jgi:hypothetical protein
MHMRICTQGELSPKLAATNRAEQVSSSIYSTDPNPHSWPLISAPALLHSRL